MTDALLAGAPADLPAATLLARVPFFAQQDYQCGPAALAMVLATDGAAVSADALVPEVWLPARAGALQVEMLATARRHGRLAVVLPPRLDAVLAEVGAGRPVIVLQNLALPAFPQWHYAVVVGFDLGRREIVLHSGATARLALPLAVFERTWARSDYWAMVAPAPETLPASPDTPALIAAAAALERVDPRAAARAYAALTARRPTPFAAWFGLGNALHAVGDAQGAERAFAQATAVDPHSADAWNNRALVQSALGRRDEALASARRAVDLGGPRSARYRETLEAIERAGSR